MITDEHIKDLRKTGFCYIKFNVEDLRGSINLSEELFSTPITEKNGDILKGYIEISSEIENIDMIGLSYKPIKTTQRLCFYDSYYPPTDVIKKAVASSLDALERSLYEFIQSLTDCSSFIDDMITKIEKVI